MPKEQKDMMVFGFGLGLIAAVCGVGGLLKHGLYWAPVVLFVCSVVFISVTVLDWQALKPGYRGWMKAAHILGAVITTGILGIVFCLIFVPVGLLFKLVRKDHLQRRWLPHVPTYWELRPRAPFDRRRYQQQF